MSIAEGAGTEAATLQNVDLQREPVASAPVVVQQMPSTQVVVMQPQPVHGGNDAYFSMRADTRDYAEPMKPWLTDGRSYLFNCCTEFKVESVLPKGGCCGGAANVVNFSSSGWVHAVYHTMGSDRLIIKRKSAASSLSKVRKNPLVGLAYLMILAGFIMLVVGASNIEGGEEDDDDDGYDDYNSYDNYDDYEEEEDNGGPIALLIIGILVFVLGIVLCMCKRTSKVSETSYDLLTQSIPIDSIFFVERNVTQRSALTTGCCSGSPPPLEVEYTDIAIGYNRSNLSTVLKLDASGTDTIKISLESNQAYNLHQYLNDIMDGSHPELKGSVRGQRKLLPRN